MNYLELLKLAAPEAIVVGTAFIILALSLAHRPAEALSSFVGLAGLALAAGAVMTSRPGTIPGGMLVVSPLNSLFKIISLGLGFLAILLANSEKSLRHRAEFVALLLFATVGLLLLIGSEELLMIFIGLELLGLSLYLLTAFDKNEMRSAEAGLKYFLFGSTASAFTLFGLSFVYGLTGTTGLAEIGARLTGLGASPLLALGIVMTLVGFAFKIAAAPFHLWAPDAYQGAPPPSAAFIASASKVASFVVLGKIVLVALAPVRGSAAWHGLEAGWSPLLGVLAAASILLGNFVALAQSDVRRLLAYSAVAHGGYTLLGLIAGGSDGFSATLFYTTVYAITLLGAFAVCGAVRQQTGGTDLSNFFGLWARSPALAGCMAIFMLSLAGLPPLAGFFGKFFLFSMAFRAGGLLWLVAIALFGSLVSLYYYLIVLKAVFIDLPAKNVRSFPRATTDPFAKVTLALTSFAVLILGFAPQLLVARIAAALP